MKLYVVTLVTGLLICLQWISFAQCSFSANANSSGRADCAIKHDSKDDVTAIGNRNIGARRGLGNWYSLEKELRIGRRYAAQVDATNKFIRDPVVLDYVNRVGQNLVRNSDALVPFTIKVIDSEEINAFALPGGFLYVDSGVVLSMDDEAELAAVMAHEIAHVAARHVTRQMTRTRLINLASIPFFFLGGGTAQLGAGPGVQMTVLAFARSFDREADYLAIQYLYAAGYDPQAYLYLLEKAQTLEKKRGTLAQAFSSYPRT